MRVPLAVLILLAPLAAAAGSRSVRGYVKNDGTYVAPHRRSSSNATASDNYSAKGNVNPYTGKKGSKDPYAPKK